MILPLLGVIIKQVLFFFDTTDANAIATVHVPMQKFLYQCLTDARRLAAGRIEISASFFPGKNSDFLKEGQRLGKSELFQYRQDKGRVLSPVAFQALHSIGKVAFSVSCGQKFLPGLLHMLQQGDVCPLPGRADGGHHTGCSCTYHYDVIFLLVPAVHFRLPPTFRMPLLSLAGFWNSRSG